METLATLPHQVRRNLDLLRDLDSSCSAGGDRMRQLHQEYIRQAEEKVMQLEIIYKQHNGGVGIRTLNGEQVIMPTTLEMMDYTYDEGMNNEIKKLHRDCLQMADEKVGIAQQTYEMVDAIVQRLERDMEAMEKILQVRAFGCSVTVNANALSALSRKN